MQIRTLSSLALTFLAFLTAGPRTTLAQSLVVNPDNLYCSLLAPEVCRNLVYYNRDTTRPGYLRGDRTVAYVRFVYSNNTDLGNGTVIPGQAVDTAQFYPTVDEYTSLTIPNTYAKLVTYQDVQIKVEFTFSGYMYDALAPKRWAKNQKAVPFRTVIVTMDQGLPTKIEWEQTKCYFADCDCVDEMCPVKCEKGDCDLKIYLGWAGTDIAGNILNSASYSIYRFQNVL